MAKIALSARELARKIRERLDEPELRVAIYFDKIRGWHAVAYGSPDTVAEKQLRVDRAVNGLRTDYDLKE